MKNKHIKYFKYLLKHKYYCFIECCKLGIPWRGLVHDLSKFLPCEWFAYVEYFYGKNHETMAQIGKRYPGDVKNLLWKDYAKEIKNSEEMVQERFDLAWLIHQRKNKHHHQFWLLKYDDGDVKPILMPPSYVKEMVADWKATGKSKNGKDDVLEWYRNNKDIMQLNPYTKCYVEKLLGVKQNNETS